MAKLFDKPNTEPTTIALEHIFESGNVREDYNAEKIEELAQSILQNGLLNPITLKRSEQINDIGDAMYELVCGHRRLRAFKHLVSTGQDFNRIPAVIKTGDKHVLQLIENIQRENLSIDETEKALQTFIDAGLKKTEIAKILSKDYGWVQQFLKGMAIRKDLSDIGIDTDGIHPRTLSKISSVENIPEAVQELKEMGPSMHNALKISREKKSQKPKREQYSISVWFDERTSNWWAHLSGKNKKSHFGENLHDVLMYLADEIKQISD